MSRHDIEELRAISKMMKDENVRNAISEKVIKDAEEQNKRICELLEELPATVRWNIKHHIYDVQYEMKKPKDIDRYCQIEYIGIHEKPWALCGSTVILKINGQEIEFDHILGSGGSVSWGEDGDEINIGPWCVGNLPEYLEKYEEEITKVINDNVEWGCCGRCI